MQHAAIVAVVNIAVLRKYRCYAMGWKRFNQV